MAELIIDAEVGNLEKVFDFIHTQLEGVDCSPRELMQIELAVDEIFVNIANYAYDKRGGKAKISCFVKRDPIGIEISFEDSGVKYDPLEREDPDITLSAEERQIGGLGIYIVKKNMDSIDYRYENGRNILTIRKKIGE